MMEDGAVVPEDFGRKMSFGVFRVKDIMIFTMVFLFFVSLSLLVPNLWLQAALIFLGLVISLLIAFRKVDGLDFYAYIALIIRHRRIRKIRNFSGERIYVYDDGVLFNGNAYLRIIEILGGVPLNFMGADDKYGIMTAYETLLNACDFPLQIVIRSREVNPEVFASLVKDRGTLADEYRSLLVSISEGLYLQFFYLVVPVLNYELTARDENSRYRQARDMLDVRTGVVIAHLSSMGLGARVVEDPHRAYEVLKSFGG